MTTISAEMRRRLAIDLYKLGFNASEIAPCLDVTTATLRKYIKQSGENFSDRPERSDSSKIIQAFATTNQDCPGAKCRDAYTRLLHEAITDLIRIDEPAAFHRIEGTVLAMGILIQPEAEPEHEGYLRVLRIAFGPLGGDPMYSVGAQIIWKKLLQNAAQGKINGFRSPDAAFEMNREIYRMTLRYISLERRTVRAVFSPEIPDRIERLIKQLEETDQQIIRLWFGIGCGRSMDEQISQMTNQPVESVRKTVENFLSIIRQYDELKQAMTPVEIKLEHSRERKAEAREQNRTNPERVETLLADISTLFLPNRLIKRLREYGLRYVGDLIRQSRQDLLARKGIAERSVDIIETALGIENLSLDTVLSEKTKHVLSAAHALDQD